MDDDARRFEVGLRPLEERLALATAWSDERKETVVETVADHRLSELTFEAREHDQPLVHIVKGRTATEATQQVHGGD